MSGTVIVGYDGSEPSERALVYAAREAELRGAALLVFHGYHFGRPSSPMIFPAPALQQVYEEGALHLADVGVEYVRSRFPDLVVRSAAEAGRDARMLAEAGAHADLIVVGNRGRGGFAGLLLGSVSMRTLGAARCPVVVVRGEGQPRGRVVAALDIGDPAAGTVLDFAFEEASLRHADLMAVYAWDQDAPLLLDIALDIPGIDDAARTIAADCDDQLADLVRRAGAKHPEVTASHRVATTSPTGLLVAESKLADLLVVGARRHGHDQPGMRIGPVTAAVVHHAECPVAVVPHT